MSEVEEGIELYQQLKDRRGEAKACNTLGILFYFQSKYQKAQELYEKALALVEGSNNVLLRGEVCFNLAEVVELAGDIPQAICYFREALTCFQQSEDSPNIKRAEKVLDRFSPR